MTNSNVIAYEFAINDSQISVALTGGMLRNSELAVQGYLAELALKELHVNKVIMGRRLSAWSAAGRPTTCPRLP